MKSIVLAFALVACGSLAQASTTETVLGPVVLVERSYSVDLKALSGSLQKSSSDSKLFIGKVVEYKLNGTENYTKEGNAYLSFTTSDSDKVKGSVNIFGFAAGYTASVELYKVGTLEDAKALLEQAYKALKLDSEPLTVRVQLVK